MPEAYLFVDETGAIFQAGTPGVVVGCLVRAGSPLRDAAFVKDLLFEQFAFAGTTLHGWLLGQPVWLLAGLLSYRAAIQEFDSSGQSLQTLALEEGALPGQIVSEIAADVVGRVQRMDSSGRSKQRLRGSLQAHQIAAQTWLQGLNWAALQRLSHALQSASTETARTWKKVLASASGGKESSELHQALRSLEPQLRRATDWRVLERLAREIRVAANRSLGVLLPPDQSLSSPQGHAWLGAVVRSSDNQPPAAAWLAGLAKIAHDAEVLLEQAGLASAEVRPLVPQLIWTKYDGEEPRVRKALTTALAVRGSRLKLTSASLASNADVRERPGYLLADWTAYRSGLLLKDDHADWPAAERKLKDRGVHNTSSLLSSQLWPHATATLTEIGRWRWLGDAQRLRETAGVS